MRGGRWAMGVVAAMTLAVAGAAPAAAEDRQIGGMKVRVLLPASYTADGQDRWPVLYVVPGSAGTADSAVRDLALATWAGRADAIVAIVWETGDDTWNYLTDYFDGSSPLDTQFAGQVVPWVDGAYRTDTSRRAIVGYSSGGYSSVEIPTQHPGMFSAVGAFSGLVDITDRDPAGEWAVLAPNLLFDVLDQHDDALRRWGNPATDTDDWHAKNPADHADRLKGTAVVYVAAGDGTPENDGPDVQSDPTTAAGLGPQVEAEEEIGSMTKAYDAALTSAGVAHTYRPHHGIHSPVHWREDLAAFWPLVQRAWAD